MESVNVSCLAMALKYSQLWVRSLWRLSSTADCSFQSICEGGGGRREEGGGRREEGGGGGRREEGGGRREEEGGRGGRREEGGKCSKVA